MKTLLKKILPRNAYGLAVYLNAYGRLVPARVRQSARMSGRRRRQILFQIRHPLPSVEIAQIIGRGPEKVSPPITQDICLPPHFGPTDHDDFSPLMQMVRARQPKIVLELGTAHGNTVANICHTSPQSQVWTVNAPVEEQTGTTVTFELSREEIGRAYRASGFEDRVVQIFENTLHLDLSQYFKGREVDLAIIDACHDTAYVLNDFEKVAPFIKPGGVVLFHDTHPRLPADSFSGSYIACILLRRKGYDIRHLRGTWWGIWINGRPAS